MDGIMAATGRWDTETIFKEVTGFCKTLNWCTTVKEKEQSSMCHLLLFLSNFSRKSYQVYFGGHYTRQNIEALEGLFVLSPPLSWIIN